MRCLPLLLLALVLTSLPAKEAKGGGEIRLPNRWQENDGNPLKALRLASLAGVTATGSAVAPTLAAEPLTWNDHRKQWTREGKAPAAARHDNSLMLNAVGSTTLAAAALVATPPTAGTWSLSASAKATGFSGAPSRPPESLVLWRRAKAEDRLIELARVPFAPAAPETPAEPIALEVQVELEAGDELVLAPAVEVRVAGSALVTDLRLRRLPAAAPR